MVVSQRAWTARPHQRRQRQRVTVNCKLSRALRAVALVRGQFVPVDSFSGQCPSEIRVYCAARGAIIKAARVLLAIERRLSALSPPSGLAGYRMHCGLAESSVGRHPPPAQGKRVGARVSFIRHTLLILYAGFLACAFLRGFSRAIILGLYLAHHFWRGWPTLVVLLLGM